MMVRLRMEELTIFAVVLSLMIWVMECTMVEGKVLDPIYWNSSNPMFKAGSRSKVDVDMYDRLDIICPRQGRDHELLYFKLYLVKEDQFRNCNVTGGRRLITCNVPKREKKYTFYFQPLSPSPWGLEFDANKAYYVISTSDGKAEGINNKRGGVCSQHNMKIQLLVHAQGDTYEPAKPEPPPVNHPTPDVTVVRPPTIHVVENRKPVIKEKSTTVQAVAPTNNSGAEEPSGNNGLVIGIVLGACAVLFVVLIAFLGYKVYKRRRHMKKYQSPPITPTRGSTPLQQVTLLPIASGAHHAHPHHHHGRLHSESDRHRSATLTSHTDLRPPPSYNESFLDNGGPVVAV